MIGIITHVTARAAERRADAAEAAIPERNRRARVDARTKAIDDYLKPRIKYIPREDVLPTIAGARIDYLHRHTVNLGTRRWPDYRAEYETFFGIIQTGTTSKTGKSVDHISTSDIVLVRH